MYSNKPAPGKGAGFVVASNQWVELKRTFEKKAMSGKYAIALKCDVSQYFWSINQHELINQLEHQGLPTELVRFMENFLGSLTVD